MLSRKINAGVGLLSTFLLLYHAISNAIWMLSRGGIAKNGSFMSWILMGVMVIHIYISIELAISAHMGIEKRKCKSYPRMNVSTIIQRVSGVLLIVLTALHVGGTTGYLQPPKVVHAILPPLFFSVALLHAALSTSKALITLGIGNAKTIRIADTIVKIICGATLIADLIGFYLCLV